MKASYCLVCVNNEVRFRSFIGNTKVAHGVRQIVGRYNFLLPNLRLSMFPWSCAMFASQVASAPHPPRRLGDPQQQHIVLQI